MDSVKHPVTDMAAELGGDWHTVNRAVLSRDEALLSTGSRRVGTVQALSFDDTLFNREGA